MKIQNNPEEQRKIKQCTDEIRAVLKKYDFAGVVTVTGKDTSRYMYEVEPTWSCLKFQSLPNGAEEVRFKCALKTGTEAEKQRGKETIGMVMGLLDAANSNREELQKLALLIGQHVGIDHGSRRLDE